MTWTLTDSRYVPSLHAWRESVFTSANGYLSTRGSLEEPHHGRSRATFVNGLFVTPAGGVARQTAVPDWTDVRLTVDGEPVSVDHGWVIGQTRSLHLRTGEVERRLLWRGEHTPTVAISFRRLLPLHEPSTAALEVELKLLDGAGVVAVETGIDASVGSPDERMWRPLSWDRPDGAALTLVAGSLDDRHELTIAATLDPGTAEPLVLLEDPFHHRFRTERTLPQGQSWRLRKRVVYHVGAPDEPAPEARPPEVGPYAQLVDGSRAAWDRRWATADVEVDGDPDVQLALRYAAFQLLAVAPRDDRASIPAKLLSGFGYLGHVFWDTDVFIVPWLTTAAPDLAANHLAYRWRGLPGARSKAARYGRVGAYYPWEADDQGEECTPDQAVPHAGGPPIEVHTAQYEEHISADVAWSTWDHWQWTQDERGLHEQWAEIILDTARYWADRVEQDPDGTGHLRDVIGPDEYHERVDDSWFTNQMVRWHLRCAAQLLDDLTATAPAIAEQLSRRLELDPGSPGAWRELATRIVLLEDEDGVPLEHVGFDELPRVDIAEWTPRRTTMQRLLGPSVRRVQIAKQADVVMALALLGPAAEVPTEVAARALDRYLPVTDHGSSLSLPVHAWLAARLGRSEQAYELLRAAIDIEHDDAMGNGGYGLHGATNGGILLATLRGIAGLAPGSNGPTTAPVLPGHWRSLRFHAHHHGRPHAIEVSGAAGRAR